jgi:hypothetical protein
MSGWLKAGLIGGGILIVLQLIGLIPFLGCLTLPLTILTYIVVGVLAASYLPPVRQAGQGAGQGVLASLVAQFIGGIVGLIIAIIQAASGATANILSQIPPEALRQLRSAGVPANMLIGTLGASICGSVCCVIGIVTAAVLGAIGGAVYTAVKPR